METPKRIRVELTPEQVKQIKDTYGHEIRALEFELDELEQRITPFCASGTHFPS